MPVDIRKPLKKYLPYLLSAQADNLNEADTVQHLVKVLEEVFGYDAMTEITREKQIKDRYVDLAVKVDGVVRLLVEVKSAGTTLRDRHIEQAQNYAANDNLRWVLLTNGVVWNLYHLTFEEGIESERAFSIDLSTSPLDKAAATLGILHRSAIRKNEHETFWEHQCALNPSSLAKSLFCEEVLRLIRRDIRRREAILVDEEDLAGAIHHLFSVEVREQMGPLKIRRRRAGKSSTTTAATSAEKEESLSSLSASTALMRRKDVEPA
jgi:predicted type IV restriction endonuclease